MASLPTTEGMGAVAGIAVAGVPAEGQEWQLRITSTSWADRKP